MCGFAGFYGDSDKSVIEKMNSRIVHRGPDGEGYYTDEQVALGFRRLSIIDLKNGGQPMHSADGRYVIVFNGEIYNYRELRQRLEKKHGCHFRTDSDTEVILEAYGVYGQKTAQVLRGMFAFVIYDKEKKTLYGARDYFGIKPFYYTKVNDRTFLFGSEIKAFLDFPGFQKAVNKDALKMYLIFQYTPLQETMFKGVYKLAPGTCFTYDGENFVTEKYFEPDYDIRPGSGLKTVADIRKAVHNSVRCHKISDVEVGAFLSGGVDSGYVVSELRPDKSYSVGFEQEGFDETEDSERLCRKLHVGNRKKKLTADEFFDVLPEIQYYSDEPHANLSAVPLYHLSQMAAEEVKVVLSGEGADELFGGYEAYQPSRAGDFYKAVVPSALRKRIGKWAESKKPARGLNFLRRNALDLEDGYIGHAFIMDNEEADALLADKYRSTMRYQDVTAPYYAQAKGLDALHKKLYLDMRLWLPNDILLKADKMTMAHSLELRVPYLDKKVWHYARTLDTKKMTDRKTTKKYFRMAAAQNLPEEWAKRRKKGFPVPVRLWLREDKYYRKVRDVFMRDYVSEFFNREILLGWLEAHKQGKNNYQRRIYTAYVFLLWYEQFFILENEKKSAESGFLFNLSVDMPL